MVPLFRFPGVLFIAVGLQRSAASDPKEGSSSLEVSLDAVAASLSGDIQKEFLAEAGNELVDTEGALMSLLEVVPGVDGGRFSAPVVRFALHKYFTRRYGWHLKGLAPAGAAWDSSSPLEAIVFQKLSADIRSLIEGRLKGGGLLGREVAVLAATLEFLVHEEAHARLRGVMDMLQLRSGEVLSDRDAQNVRDWYMTSYMLGKSPWATQPLEFKGLVAEVPNMFPAWPQVTAMTNDIMSSQHQGDHRTGLSPAEFGDVVVEIGRRFGPGQNRICSDLKSSLMEIRDDGTGRVPLSEFYGAGLNGKWQFGESAEYMKKLGSLDMSNPSSPRVIIPNYVWSPSNCLGTSETHDVCCVSECEPLMAQLEHAIGAPTALPARILEVVRNLPSSTVPAGRQLPALLVNRLQAVAAANDGVVPLSGRLFAQWMHHAYSRECPYPHVAGATAPLNIFDWDASQPTSPVADISVMMQLANQSHRSEAPVLNAPWEHREELLVNVDHGTPIGTAFIHMAVTGATGSVALFGLLRSAARSVRAPRGSAQAKFTMERHALEV